MLYIDRFPPKLIINLQLFAEGETPAPATEPAPVIPAQSEPPQATVNDDGLSMRDRLMSIFSDMKGQGNEPKPTEKNVDIQVQPQLTPPAQASPPERLYANTFKSPEELEKSYMNLRSQFNQRDIEVSNLRQTIQALQSQIEAAKTPQPQAMSAEEIEAMEKDLAEKYFDDPVAATKQLLKNQSEMLRSEIRAELMKEFEPLKKELEPIKTEFQSQKEYNAWLEKAQNFAKEHSDYAQYVDDISAIFSEMPELMGKENALQYAYDMAKGRKGIPTDPIQILSNPEHRQKIINDPSVKEEILKVYLEGLKQNNAPVVIGVKPGGATTVTPEYVPKSIKEAGRMLAKQLGQQ